MNNDGLAKRMRKTMMRSYLIATFSAVLVATGLSWSVCADEPPKRSFVPNQIMMGFKSATSRKEAIAELNSAEKSGGFKTRGGSQSKSVDIEPLGDRSAVLKFAFLTRGGAEPSSKEHLEILEEYSEILREDPRVSYAHPNWILRVRRGLVREPVYFRGNLPEPQLRTQARTPSIPNDPIYKIGLQWHYLAYPTGMNAVGAWRSVRDSKSVVVAVIDTGILLDHPDIRGAGNVVAGFDFVSEPIMDADGINGRDSDPTDPGDRCLVEGTSDSWHGTHVAGTVGAAGTNNKQGIAGVSWAVSVSPIRALGRCGGTIRDISDAVRWAAGLKVKGAPPNANPADIINLSLGIQGACEARDFGILIDALSNAKKAGALVIAAAGNLSMDVKDVTPAGCSDVLSVAASDRRGHLAPYSNYGAISIMAPGGDLARDDDKDNLADGVWSLVAVTKENPYGVAALEGTSMAAPHVTGGLALVLANRAELRRNPNRLLAAVSAAAAPLPKGACGTPCGPGLFDLQRLLAYVGNPIEK